MPEEDKKKYRVFGAQGLSGVLSGLLKPMVDSNSGFTARIKTDWRLIAGDTVAVRARPYKITQPPNKKGEAILHLEVEEGFTMELQYMEQLLIEKIAIYFGYRAVSGIRCRQVEAKKREWEAGIRALTPAEKQTIGRIVGKIEDEDLKAALEKLGVSVIQKN